jgi:hypothetical protein
LAERRAVVYIGGKLQELPTGDTLAGASGGSLTISDTPPGTPSVGDLWWDSTDGTLYIYYDDGDSSQWVVTVPVADGNNANALLNRIVNPGMRHSQQVGTTAASTDLYYAADQFIHSRSHDGTVSFGQVAVASPAGSTHRIRLTVTGTDVTIGAAQYGAILQALEGTRMADALFGTADARNLLLRFGFKGPAGVYCVALRNAANNRSYIREFTATGSDQVVELTFPGDTSGTWPTTNAHWGSLIWSYAAGTDSQNTGNQWNATNDFATSNQSNLLATNAQVAELFDVGLYVDVANEGVFPIFELPPFDEDLRTCQRYFWQFSGAAATETPFAMGGHTNTNTGRVVRTYPVPMRIAPTLTVSAASHFSTYTATGTQVAVSALTLHASSNNEMCRLDYTDGGGHAAGQAAIFHNNSTSARLEFSARM